MMNGQKKIRRREKPTKRAGSSLQGIVETQMEIVEEEDHSLCPHRCSLHFALTVECPRLKLQNDWILQLVKLEGQDEAQPRNFTWMF